MNGIGQGVLTKCKITFSSYSLDQAFIVSTLNITENFVSLFPRRENRNGFLQGDCQLSSQLQYLCVLIRMTSKDYLLEKMFMVLRISCFC